MLQLVPTGVLGGAVPRISGVARHCFPRINFHPDPGCRSRPPATRRQNVGLARIQVGGRLEDYIHASPGCYFHDRRPSNPTHDGRTLRPHPCCAPSRVALGAHAETHSAGYTARAAPPPCRRRRSRHGPKVSRPVCRLRAGKDRETRRVRRSHRRALRERKHLPATDGAEQDRRAHTHIRPTDPGGVEPNLPPRTCRRLGPLLRATNRVIARGVKGGPRLSHICPPARM